MAGIDLRYYDQATDTWIAPLANGEELDALQVLITKLGQDVETAEQAVADAVSDVNAAVTTVENMEQTVTNLSQDVTQLSEEVTTHLEDDERHLSQIERDKIANSLQPNTEWDTSMNNTGMSYATRSFPLIEWANNNETSEVAYIAIPFGYFFGSIEVIFNTMYSHTNNSGSGRAIYQIASNESEGRFAVKKEIISMPQQVADGFVFLDSDVNNTSKNILIGIAKRRYQNPISIIIKVSQHSTQQSAYETANSAKIIMQKLGSFINDPIQKGFDERITENASEMQNVKQSVSNGKAVVNQAVTDMGIYTPPDAPFATTAANVRMLSTGASGNGNATNNGARTVFSVSGLKFAPRVINISFTSGNNRIVYNRSVNQNVDAFIHVGGAWHNYSASIQLTDSGFTITVATPLTGPYRWEAFK